MLQQVVLTGIKPTGLPHLGNLVGAIQPAIAMSLDNQKRAFYFIADYHALTTLKDAQLLKAYTLQVAATWIALGLNPSRVVFYRQSDVPELFELSWILACFTPKGLMNRAHAYKASVQRNAEIGEGDVDAGVNVGLYTYPVLMAADILLMQTHWVPVGGDQVQHVEIARDIAQYFNRQYQRAVFVLPEALIDKQGRVIPGVDGRKMSKSYNNTIPIFGPSDALRKRIFRIPTDSSAPGEPKDPETSTIFHLFRLVATPEQTADFHAQFLAGIAWKDAKDQLFSRLAQHLAAPRERYRDLVKDPAMIEGILDHGAEQARDLAQDTMRRVRLTIGQNLR